MKNIFERAYNLANDCMTCVYGNLFNPIEADKEDILARLKTSMTTCKTTVTLNGTRTINEYSEDIVTMYEDILSIVAKQLGELV